MKNTKLILSALVLFVVALGESNAQKHQWTRMVTADDQSVDPFQKIFEGAGDNFYLGMRFYGSIGMGKPSKKKNESIPSVNSGMKYGLFFAKYTNADLCGRK